MNMTEKNGQPSMEEILASIRRIIADEPQGPNPVIDLRAVPRPHIASEEGADFDLPQMFKAAPVPDKPAPLFGRLTDAIRSASGAAAEMRNQLRGEDGRYDPHLLASTPLNGEPRPMVVAVPADPAAHPGLSSLSIQRSDGRVYPPVEHEPEPAPPAAAPVAAAAPASAPTDEPKRVMVPFKDTKMSMMGSVPAYRPTYVPTVEEPPLEHFVAEEVANPFPVHTSQPVPHIVHPSVPPPAETVSYVAPPTPPAPGPAAPAAATGFGTIEDTTADLLRPMLRQWLAENMPRMVEKALHIEVAESVKLGRKPGSL